MPNLTPGHWGEGRPSYTWQHGQDGKAASSARGTHGVWKYIGESIWGFPACLWLDSPGEPQNSEALLGVVTAERKHVSMRLWPQGFAVWICPRVLPWVRAPCLGLGHTIPSAFTLPMCYGNDLSSDSARSHAVNLPPALVKAEPLYQAQSLSPRCPPPAARTPFLCCPISGQQLLSTSSCPGPSCIQHTSPASCLAQMG